MRDRERVHGGHRFTSQQKESWCWVSTMCLLSFIYKSYKRKVHAQTRSQTHRPPNESTLAEITHRPIALTHTRAHTHTQTYRWSWLPSWPSGTWQPDSTLKEGDTSQLNSFFFHHNGQTWKKLKIYKGDFIWNTLVFWCKSRLRQGRPLYKFIMWVT